MKRVGPSSSIPSKNMGLKTKLSSLPGKAASRYYGDTQEAGLKKKNPSSSGAKATNIENQMRYALLRKGVNFIEQADIGPWSIDFFLPEYNAVIEADGEFWHNNMKTKMKDRRKDSWLMAKGYKVFHFEGKQITDNANACVDKVLKSLHSSSWITEKEETFDELIEEINQETNMVPEDDDDEYEKWISRK